MVEKVLTDGTEFELAAGEYQLSYHSASSGTGKLQYAPDGTNFHDVADTSFSASGDVLIKLGSSYQAKWKVVLTGDMDAYLMPVQLNNVRAI